MPAWLSMALFVLFVIGALGMLYGLLFTAAARRGKGGGTSASGPSHRRIEVTDNWWFRTLRAAGIHMYPPLILAFLVLLTLLAALLFSGLFLYSALLSLSITGLLLLVLMSVLVETGRVRTIRFEEKLLDAVDLLIAALKAGETPRQALKTVAQITRNPVRREMELLSSKVEAGMSPQQAASHLVDEYPSEGVRMFSSIFVAKWMAGGDLAPVLASVNVIMRERLQYRLRIRSQMAGANITSYMVGIFPYIVLWCIYLFIPQWVDRLLVHPLGMPLLMGAFFLQVLGFVWVRSMMRVEL